MLALILALIVSIAFAEVARTLRAWNSTKMLLVLPSVARDAPPCPSWCLSESIIEALSCRGRKEGSKRAWQGKQQSNSREKTATEITTQGNRQGVEAPLEWEQREQREQLVEQQLQLPEMRYKSQDINSGTRASSSSFVVGRSEISQAKYALGVQSGELQMLL